MLTEHHLKTRISRPEADNKTVGLMSGTAPPVVVLDVSANSLSVIRNLRKHAVDVVSLASGPVVSACFTRHGRRIRLPQDPMDAPDLWLEALKDIARTYGRRPVLFPTSDATVAFVADHSDALSESCIYRGPSPCVVAKIIDKGALYEAALRQGVSVPRTHIIRKYDDLDSIPVSLSFPCIIKPSQSHIWRKLNKPGKAIIVRDQAELRRQIISLIDVLSRIPLLVQEIIPGPESNLIYLVAYLNSAIAAARFVHGTKATAVSGRLRHRQPGDQRGAPSCNGIGNKASPRSRVRRACWS